VRRLGRGLELGFFSGQRRVWPIGDRRTPGIERVGCVRPARTATSSSRWTRFRTSARLRTNSAARTGTGPVTGGRNGFGALAGAMDFQKHRDEKRRRHSGLVAGMARRSRPIDGRKSFAPAPTPNSAPGTTERGNLRRHFIRAENNCRFQTPNMLGPRSQRTPGYMRPEQFIQSAWRDLRARIRNHEKYLARMCA